MIEVNGLTKRYKSEDVIKNISFNCENNEVLAILGENGSGKSTLMKMLAGCVMPSEGSIRVYNQKIEKNKNSSKKIIGYVPEFINFNQNISCIDYLEYIAKIRKIKRNKIKPAIYRCAELCKISSSINKKIQSMSYDQQVLMMVAQALIHNPRVIILDDIFRWFDVNQKRTFYNLIRSICNDRIIVVASSTLEVLEEIGSRVIILSNGEKVFDGKSTDFKWKSMEGNTSDVFYAMTKNSDVSGVIL